MSSTPERGGETQTLENRELIEMAPLIGQTIFEALAEVSGVEEIRLDGEEASIDQGVTRLPDGQTVPDN